MRGAAELPVSGTQVVLRELSGEDELLVLESGGPPAPILLELATRLLRAPGGAPIDWRSLPAVELAAAALVIRTAWLGRTIRTETLCPAADCGEQIDVSFAIPDYLEHHRPRRYRGAVECEDGWFALPGTDVHFRIPTIGDLLDALGGGAAPLERCVRAASLSASEARRVDRALEALAPRLDGDLTGTCPACGRAVELRFEPMAYVLEELRDASTGLAEHVHGLAFAYHWSEGAILALERRRRQRYVDLIREEHALV